VTADRQVPWWGLLSSAAAPVLLIGGWMVAAARQPGGFDQVADTISALAAHGATDRWLMTTCLAGVGVCHVVTAMALRPAATPGRVLLALGGVGNLLVAAFPLPADDSGSAPHTLAAGVAFGALALWPALAWTRAEAPPLLRREAALPAAVVLLGVVGWFVAELAADTARVGLAERIAAGAQALWPLAVVTTSLNVQRRRKRGPSERVDDR
jgi:hypothetical membrane protein